MEQIGWAKKSGNKKQKRCFGTEFETFTISLPGVKTDTDIQHIFCSNQIFTRWEEQSGL